MNISFINSRNMQKTLKQLISIHDDIQIAVAWGYNGPLVNILMENSKKFSSVTFGINGFSTSPDLVDRLIGVKNAFIAQSDNVHLSS